MLSSTDSSPHPSPKGKSKLPTTTNDPAFETALAQILAGLEGFSTTPSPILSTFLLADLQDEMRFGMLKQYHDPPVSLVSQVLSTPLDVDDVRRLIFYPEVSDMALYPRLLASNAALSPPDQRRVLILFNAFLKK